MTLEQALEALRSVPQPPGYGVSVSTVDGENFLILVVHEEVFDYPDVDGGATEYDAEGYRYFARPLEYEGSR